MSKRKAGESIAPTTKKSKPNASDLMGANPSDSMGAKDSKMATTTTDNPPVVINMSVYGRNCSFRAKDGEVIVNADTVFYLSDVLQTMVQADAADKKGAITTDFCIDLTDTNHKQEDVVTVLKEATLTAGSPSVIEMKNVEDMTRIKRLHALSLCWNLQHVMNACYNAVKKFHVEHGPPMYPAKDLINRGLTPELLETHFRVIDVMCEWKQADIAMNRVNRITSSKWKQDFAKWILKDNGMSKTFASWPGPVRCNVVDYTGVEDDVDSDDDE